jgi:hypothetical protein
MGTLLNYSSSAGVRSSAAELVRNLHGMRGEALLELRKWIDARGFVDFSSMGMTIVSLGVGSWASGKSERLLPGGKIPSLANRG